MLGDVEERCRERRAALTRGGEEKEEGGAQVGGASVADVRQTEAVEENPSRAKGERDAERARAIGCGGLEMSAVCQPLC